MLKRVLVSVCLVMSVLNAGFAFAALEKGMTVLVTGANRGIGLEMARQFDALGLNVIGTARDPSSAKELKALGVQVEQLDVTDPASVSALAQRLEGAAIDVLVNNAGIGGHNASSFQEIDIEQLAHTFDVNSLGPMRVTQALLPNLESGKAKTVVQVSSIMGSIAGNRGGSYGYRASKAALNMLNKSLAGELGKQGFTCIVVHPGWVKTRMGGASAPVDVAESVAGLVTVIEGLSKADNGQFLDYQGKQIPW